MELKGCAIRFSNLQQQKTTQKRTEEKLMAKKWEWIFWFLLLLVCCYSNFWLLRFSPFFAFQSLWTSNSFSISFFCFFCIIFSCNFKYAVIMLLFHSSSLFAFPLFLWTFLSLFANVLAFFWILDVFALILIIDFLFLLLLLFVARFLKITVNRCCVSLILSTVVIPFHFFLYFFHPCICVLVQCNFSMQKLYASFFLKSPGITIRVGKQGTKKKWTKMNERTAKTTVSNFFRCG